MPPVGRLRPFQRPLVPTGHGAPRFAGRLALALTVGAHPARGGTPQCLAAVQPRAAVRAILAAKVRVACHRRITSQSGCYESRMVCSRSRYYAIDYVLVEKARTYRRTFVTHEKCGPAPPPHGGVAGPRTHYTPAAYRARTCARYRARLRVRLRPSRHVTLHKIARVPRGSNARPQCTQAFTPPPSHREPHRPHTRNDPAAPCDHVARPLPRVFPRSAAVRTAIQASAFVGAVHREAVTVVGEPGGVGASRAMARGRILADLDDHRASLREIVTCGQWCSHSPAAQMFTRFVSYPPRRPARNRYARRAALYGPQTRDRPPPGFRGMGLVILAVLGGFPGRLGGRSGDASRPCLREAGRSARRACPPRHPRAARLRVPPPRGGGRPADLRP